MSFFKKLTIVIFILLVTTSTIVYFRYNPKVTSCEKIKVYLWQGRTIQNNYTYDFQNIKFKYVTNECINSMGNKWDLLIDKKLFAQIHFNNDDSTYTWQNDNHQKYLKLFESEIPNAVNFTIPKNNDLNEKPTFIEIVANKKIKFNLISNKSMTQIDNLTLPEVTIKKHGVNIEACSNADDSYAESIRLNFIIQNPNGIIHKQIVCTDLEPSLENNSKQICCRGTLPENIKEYGVVRWRGDETHYLFKEKFESLTN